MTDNTPYPPLTAPELLRPVIDFPDVSYDQLFRQAAELYPTKPAIIYYNLTLTYNEVLAMVNSISNGLHNLGLQKGDCICLYTLNRPEYIITFLAAASLGLIISPMNPAYKESEIRYQLSDTEARALLVQRELIPVLKSALAQSPFPDLSHIIVTGTETIPEIPTALPFATLLRNSSSKYVRYNDVQSNDILALPYSSGTTGLPKGTILTHRNLATNNLQFMTVLHFEPADTALLFLPFYHIYGVMLTGSFLACGGTKVLMERFDLQQSLHLCKKHAITYYFAVPPVVLALANTAADLSSLNHVKAIFSGAAPLAIGPAQRLQSKIAARVLQGYGLTEASPLTHSMPGLDLIRLGSIGMPVHNTEQKIVDLETGEREVSPGEIGELIVRGPQVMQGYWKAPEETERALRNGWLYTGDIGYEDADGYTYIVDRKKEMIKYKGFGVAPAELEALLLEHPAILDAAVIGVPDDEAGELIKGFVVLRPGSQVTGDEILDYTNNKVAGYKRLHFIEFIDALPKTASGKILRRTLRERERQQHLPSSEA